MKRAFSLLLALSLVLPLPALGAEELSYEEALYALTTAPGYTVERVLYSSNAAAVLRWQNKYPSASDLRDYELYLVRQVGQPAAQRLLLPSTALPFGSYAPTDRGPDSLSLSEDGLSLAYAYRFQEALLGPDGDPLHEVGTYTYQVDLATGELTVAHRVGTGDTGFLDVLSTDWFAPYVEVCVEEGLMKGTGEGKFSPHAVLSGYECAVLALRLHNLGQGGDGTFEKAPWDWGYVFMTLPDGTVKEGYLSDGTVWDWTRLHRADDGHFGFRLNIEEEKEWGRSMDYQAVTLSLNGAEYTGELHLAGEGFLYYDFANMDDYHAIHRARVPTPNAWWRDAWYYAERNGLTHLLMAGNDERWTFAERMAAVTDLPAINDIQGLPDTGVPDTLELYRAGVLTGSDEYGTFREYSTMTRAEGAAICARILRPELRVSFSPKPLETYESYTLTYLREDGVREGGPYTPLQSMDLLVPDRHSLLRLDGVEVPIPEGYEVEAIGEGLAGLVNWDAETFGLIDREGQFRECSRQDIFENPDLSIFHYNTNGLINGYQLGANRFAFYNEKGEQVTPAFDWASFVNSEGAGFVGLDRKIYRIQFEK